MQKIILNFLQQFGRKIFLVTQRFPFTSGLAFATACWHITALIIIFPIKYSALFIRIEIDILFAFLLFFLVEFYLANQARNRIWVKLLFFLGALCVLGVIFMILPDKILLWQLYTLAICGFVIFLAIMTLPLIRFKEDLFWKYNALLAVNTLISMVLANIMCLGINVALATINYLFTLDLEPKIFLYNAILFYNFVMLIFFLALYPAELKVYQTPNLIYQSIIFLGKFVLLPLSVIYFVILYIYAGTILFTQHWPKGMVCYLVLAFCGVGLICNWFLYPKIQEKFYKYFFKIYYALTLPLLVLLFIAIKMRIDQYGITENRYYVVTAGIWLVILCGYYIFSRKMRLQFMNYSLAVILGLTLVGPWNVFALAKNQQLKNLDSLLSKTTFAETQDINPTVVKQLSSSEQQQLNSILKYFMHNHGNTEIQKYFKDDITDYTYGELVSIYKLKISQLHTLLRIDNSEVLADFDVSGYQHFYQLEYYNERNSLQASEKVELLNTKNALIVSHDGQKIYLSFAEPLTELLAAYPKGGDYTLNSEQLSFNLKNGKASGKFIISMLSVDRADNTVQELSGYLLTNF